MAECNEPRSSRTRKKVDYSEESSSDEEGDAPPQPDLHTALSDPDELDHRPLRKKCKSNTYENKKECPSMKELRLTMNGSKGKNGDQMGALRTYLRDRTIDGLVNGDGKKLTCDEAVVYILWEYTLYYETLDDDEITRIAALNSNSRPFAAGTMSYANPLNDHTSTLSAISELYQLDQLATVAAGKYKGFSVAALLSHYHKDLLGKDEKQKYLPIDFSVRYKSALQTSMAKCAYGKMTLERAVKGRGLDAAEREQVKIDTYNISLPFMKLIKSVREGQELGPGLFEIFSIKDKVFTDGRFQFQFESFSWADVSQAASVIESTNHPLTRGLYEFMKYSQTSMTDKQNAKATHHFFDHNSVLTRSIIRGRGFRLTLTSPCGDDVVYSVAV